jgi:hypothetical protein
MMAVLQAPISEGKKLVSRHLRVNSKGAHDDIRGLLAGKMGHKGVILSSNCAFGAPQRVNWNAASSLDSGLTWARSPDVAGIW